MPKILPEDLAKRIAEMVAATPGGLAAREISKRLRGQASTRTTARRLAELVAAGRLVTRGKARALRYLAARNTGTASLILEPLQVTGEIDSYVPVSKDGAQVRDYVRKPITARHPVGYRREFLEKYLPNKTWYLPLATRKRLADLGRSSREERPAGTYARQILNRLLVELSWASSRLEGNTYTRLETQRLIELGQAAEGKDQRDAQMILNHKAAIEMLVENVDEIGFNAYTFTNLHANLSENLLADPMMGGRLRTQIVEIQGTVFHPLSMPHQVEEYFSMILRKVAAIGDPFEQAFFIMAQIPYLQPFVDMNKRVSRLGANIPFIKSNLCPLSFVDVPERAYVDATLGVYELNRIELLRDVFVWAYERSCQRLLAIQESVAAPDPVRLRYRDALSIVIADIVRSGARSSPQDVRGRAQALVAPADLDRFVEITMRELANLHGGNIARYRIRLSEYARWKGGAA